MSAPEGWGELLGRLEPYVSPEWSSHAREHGEQPWIRLILLVDAHHQLSTPRVVEKVAMTMADLAVDREKEREGWEAVRASAADQRVASDPGSAVARARAPVRALDRARAAGDVRRWPAVIRATPTVRRRRFRP